MSVQAGQQEKPAPVKSATFLVDGSNATERTHTRTLSGTASGVDSLGRETLGLQDSVHQATIKLAEAGIFLEDETLPEDFLTLLERLELLQRQQRSPQQSTPELDALIKKTLSQRPELRQRLAVKTKSALLRNKILTTLPGEVRAVGSHRPGHTHPWRKMPDETLGDHNWPALATMGSTGLQYLPGGGMKNERHLRASAELVQYDPTISHTPNFSIPRAQRFSGADRDGQVSKAKAQRLSNATPGPGDYFKSVPRGTAFRDDDTDADVLGPNHIYPWKSALGRMINPVHCDATVMTSSPTHSFPKARRPASEVSLGHGQQVGGPVKTDRGCLGPGPIYEYSSSFRPREGKVYMPRARKARSETTLRTGKVRSQYVPLETAQGTVLHHATTTDSFRTVAGGQIAY